MNTTESIASDTLPIKRSPKLPKTEFHSSEIPEPSSSRQELPSLGEELPEPEHIEPVSSIEMDRAAEMAFMEEPIVIVISPSAERNPMLCTDLVSIGGVWAKIWMLPSGRLASSLSEMGSGRWMPFGYLPKGYPIVTKRMFANELAKSYTLHIVAGFDPPKPNEEPVNYINRTVQRTQHFSVVEDRSPRGREWITNILHGRLAR